MRTERIEKALEIAKVYFEPKLRNNGKNYYEDHILKVYEEVVALGGNEQACIDAILHDMYEDTDIDNEYIIAEFGEVTDKHIKLLTIDKSRKALNEGLQVQKALDTPETTLVRFADRYSNLKCTSISENSEEFVKRIVFKTKRFYIPFFEGEYKSKLKEEVDRLIKEINSLNFKKEYISERTIGLRKKNESFIIMDRNGQKRVDKTNIFISEVKNAKEDEINSYKLAIRMDHNDIKDYTLSQVSLKRDELIAVRDAITEILDRSK